MNHFYTVFHELAWTFKGFVCFEYVLTEKLSTQFGLEDCFEICLNAYLKYFDTNIVKLKNC